MTRREPAILFIFVTLFLDVFGFGLVIPIMPKLVQELQHGNEAQAAEMVGWLLSLFALMQFVFSPVLGSLSDHFGRRPVILTSLFGSGIDYLLLAWAPTLPWLFLGRLISGITASNFTAAGAYIADVTPPEKRAAGFGMIGAAFGLGFIAGPAASGLLAKYGLRVPFLVSAGVTLLNWLYGALVLPESLSKENRRPFTWASAHPVEALNTLRTWPVVAGLAGALFLVNVAHNIYPSLWVLYTSTRYHWSITEVSLSLALVGLVTAIVQAGLAGKILGCIGERTGMFAGLLVMVLAMTGYGLSPAGWMIYAIIVLGAVNGISNPAAQAIISRSAPANQQGSVQGALNSIGSIASIIAPPIWSKLFAWSIAPGQRFIPGLPFIAAGGITLAAVGLVWRTFRREKMTSAALSAAEPPSVP
jgi:DHA1 family tetracycline resistance protein-like MFS transporter